MTLKPLNENIERAAILLLLILPYLSYINFFLPSDISRISLLIIFFTPIAILILSKKYMPSSRITILSLISIAAIVFIRGNTIRANTFLNGLEISDTRTLAQMYIDNGQMVFPDSHSFFPQTGVTLYFLSIIGGLNLVQASIVTIISYILLRSMVVYYAIDTVTELSVDYKNLLVCIIGIVSVSVCSSTISTNLIYRTLASPLYLLLLIFMYRRYYGENPMIEYIPITILLSIGVTLGDPTSAMVMIPFFILVSLIGDRKIDFLYALIPLTYFTFSATSYILAIRGYSRFAINGVIEFVSSLLRMEFPERVIPWRRTSSLSLWDNYIASSGFLALLLVAGVIGLYYTLKWVISKDPLHVTGKNLLENTAGATLLAMTGVAGLTYIGASVRPEVAFSDIRTIAMLFAASLLAFSVIPQAFKKLLSYNKLLPTLFIIIFLLSSVRGIYQAYPKSIYDPPNILEDNRLGSDSVFIYANFHNTYYKSGGLVIDWKTHNRIQEAIQDTEYERRWINATTLDYPFAGSPLKSIIVFNQLGTEIPSLYHPPQAYQAAYNYSIAHNRIYDDGVVIAAQHEGT